MAAQDMHVCIARAAADDYSSHRKTLTMWPRFIFEVNARSLGFVRVNASAFLPSLRVRCSSLFVLVLFAVKNGTRAKEFNVKETVRYETIYAIQNKYIVFVICYNMHCAVL